MRDIAADAETRVTDKAARSNAGSPDIATSRRSRHGRQSAVAFRAPIISVNSSEPRVKRPRTSICHTKRAGRRAGAARRAVRVSRAGAARLAPTEFRPPPRPAGRLLLPALHPQPWPARRLPFVQRLGFDVAETQQQRDRGAGAEAAHSCRADRSATGRLAIGERAGAQRRRLDSSDRGSSSETSRGVAARRDNLSIRHCSRSVAIEIEAAHALLERQYRTQRLRRRYQDCSRVIDMEARAGAHQRPP